MRPFWHPLSALLLTDPPSYATPGMIRMFLRGAGSLELRYAGDRMWPAVRQGQRVGVRSLPEDRPLDGSVVVAELDGIPDLLRVGRVGAGHATLTADADPGLCVETEDAALLAVADLPPRIAGAAVARLRRLFLDHVEACVGAPDDAPAASVLFKYDGQAPYYAASGASLPPSLLQRIRRHVRPGGRILVAGSGTGMECFALAEEGWQVTGVDFAPRMVELAQRENERRNLHVRFHRADLLEHEERAGSLAAVLFTYDVYSFLPHRQGRCRILEKMSEWLEPNGCILLSARRPSRPYDRWILTLQWLRRGMRRWGHSHTRWVSANGALHRSFVQVHGEPALAREARRARAAAHAMPFLVLQISRGRGAPGQHRRRLRAGRGRRPAGLEDGQPRPARQQLRNIDDVLIKKRETFYGRLVSLCVEIREAAGCPIILGGSGYSLFPEKLLDLAGAHFGVQGEGESCLVALLEALERGARHAGIPGLVFRENGAIVASPPQAADAGAIGPAHRPAHIVDYYRRSSQMLNVQTQRGCAAGCCYCTYPVIEGRFFRGRPAEAVVEELAALKRGGARYFFIVDSIFNSSAEHVASICEAILRGRIDLPWGCFLRPSRLTAELMRLMRRAGLTHIEFGSDSFCDPVLAAYRKGFTFEDIRAAHELAVQEDIECCHFLIAGGPGDTVETLEGSFANSRRLERALILALVGMRVYPGTALFEQAREEGRLAEDADLLQPYYYLSPALQEAEIFARLERFARQSPAWIVGDPPPRYLEMARRLRQQGCVGPLWSYLPLIQRLAPVVGRGKARPA